MRCGIESWDDATEKLISCTASLGTFRFMTISFRLSFLTGFSEGLSLLGTLEILMPGHMMIGRFALRFRNCCTRSRATCGSVWKV